jgi:phosphoribosylformylglycinamidine synthase
VPCVQIGLTGGREIAIAGERAVAVKALQHGFESWLPDYMAGKG